MKKLRWQLLIVVLALAAIGVLLLSQQPAVLENITPVQPASGGIYTEALIGSFGRLNPILDYYNSADRDVCRLLFRGLIRFNDRGLPEADIAESWAASADGTSYSFSIREDAVWHDGEPVTSEDVVYTIELLRNENIPVPSDIRELWNQVDVEILDEKTVQFILPEPFAPILDYLTFGILPEHQLGDLAPEELVDASFNLEPVGNGPYRFDHLITENGQIQGVVLSAFKDFYGEPPFIDQVIFRYYPDSQSALAAYQQGEVMGISHISPEVLAEALKEPELGIYTGRLPHLTLVYLNLDHPELPFFQDATLRRALLMGINRQWMIDRLLQGQAILADGPIFPGTWAYYDGIERLPYDPKQALAMIREAGYSIPASGGSVREKDGRALSFEMVYPDTPTHKAIAETIQRDWTKLGVDVALVAVPYEELVSSYLDNRTYQAALVDLNLARSPDPDPYPFWDQAQATGGQNYAQWDDRQASEFLEQARVETDIGERTKIYRNFQVRYTMEMPALPLFYPVYTYGVDDQVQQVRIGSFFDPSDRFNTIGSWFLRSPEPEEVFSNSTETQE